MPEINQLSSLDTLSESDQFPVYSEANADARKVTAATIAQFVKEQIEPAVDETVYSLAVVGSTFTTAIVPAEPGAHVYALLAPPGAFTAGTIALPGIDSRADGQEVLVSCTQSVASLTVSGNGATANGAPTSLAANGFFRMRFDSISSAWYRIG